MGTSNPLDPESNSSRLARLIEMMPPSTLIAPIDIPWHESTSSIGVEFPADYRQFIETYGSGSISGDLAIAMPWRIGGPPYLPEMEEFGVFMVRAQKMSTLNRLHFDSSVAQRWPYAFWPEVGGLLPWARNLRYGYLFWLTRGNDADLWPCVAWNQSEWRLYECSMLELLVTLVSGADEFLSSFVDHSQGPIGWTTNADWPSELPESMRIGDDDVWTLPAAKRERGVTDEAWDLLQRLAEGYRNGKDPLIRPEKDVP